MRFRCFHGCLILLIIFGIGTFQRPHIVQAQGIQPGPLDQATAYDLIIAMNTLRVSNGLPALVEDPIINAVAQSTAASMAANNMSWHIGDVRGRLAAAGYGGGGTVWATENFAMYSGGTGIDEIMAMWADPDHMRPATTAAYCHVGAGVAQASNGRIYYVLQAAYVSERACGSLPPSSGGTYQPGSTVNAVPQLIMPVKIATPDAEGRIYHVVQAGQSYWSIAIAYQITIRDIEAWNNLSRNTPLQSGQRLFIPGKNTAGYATPTPFGMIVPAAPDADGRIVHEVQPYQALITIAEAYKVPVDRILALNGLQADWPLQIGQKLVISPGNITPSPTLSAIQKLTPEPDGKYYHTVESGETLSWIAGLYQVQLADLMSWNGLVNSSVIRPGQKLLLLVTPPATATATQTATHTPGPPTSTPTAMALMTQPPPTSTAFGGVSRSSGSALGLQLGLILAAVALGMGGWYWMKFSRKDKA